MGVMDPIELGSPRATCHYGNAWGGHGNNSGNLVSRPLATRPLNGTSFFIDANGANQEDESIEDLKLRITNLGGKLFVCCL